MPAQHTEPHSMPGNDYHRTLILSGSYPLPENIGSRMRTMNFVRYFKKYGDVDLLYLVRASKEIEESGMFRKEYCINLWNGPNNERKRNKKDIYRIFKERLKIFVDRHPPLFRHWSSGALRDFIRLIVKEEYDFILCRYVSDAYPLFSLPKKYRNKIIIDFDDIYSDSYFNSQIGSSIGIYSKFKELLKNKLIMNFQRRCLTIGSSIFCSKVDLDIVNLNRNSRRAYVIPNTYPIGISPCAEGSDGYVNKNIFLFIGTLDYEPNILGLKWFINTIFPRIKYLNVNSRLIVVGRYPIEDIIKLCSETPGVELHADVPEVLSYYEKSGIFIVPILSGGGTRIKILEAAIAGRPVFSTPFGAYGLDVEDGKDIMIFSDADSFIGKYNIICDKGKYNSMVERFRNIVGDKYSMDGFTRGMDIVCRNIIELSYN